MKKRFKPNSLGPSVFRIWLLGGILLFLQTFQTFAKSSSHNNLAAQTDALHLYAHRIYKAWLDGNLASEDPETLKRCFELFPDKWKDYNKIYHPDRSQRCCTIPHYYNLKGVLSALHEYALAKVIDPEIYYTKMLSIGVGGYWQGEDEFSWVL